jgi:hypothetical protein
MKERTVTIKYEELEYVPRSMTVSESEADEIYRKLKRRHDIRNLRRL